MKRFFRYALISGLLTSTIGITLGATCPNSLTKEDIGSICKAGTKGHKVGDALLIGKQGCHHVASGKPKALKEYKDGVCVYSGLTQTYGFVLQNPTSTTTIPLLAKIEKLAAEPATPQNCKDRLQLIKGYNDHAAQKGEKALPEPQKHKLMQGCDEHLKADAAPPPPPYDKPEEMRESGHGAPPPPPHAWEAGKGAHPEAHKGFKMGARQRKSSEEKNPAAVSPEAVQKHRDRMSRAEQAPPPPPPPAHMEEHNPAAVSPEAVKKHLGRMGETENAPPPKSLAEQLAQAKLKKHVPPAEGGNPPPDAKGGIEGSLHAAIKNRRGVLEESQNLTESGDWSE